MAFEVFFIARRLQSMLPTRAPTLVHHAKRIFELSWRGLNSSYRIVSGRKRLCLFFAVNVHSHDIKALNNILIYLMPSLTGSLAMFDIFCFFFFLYKFSFLVNTRELHWLRSDTFLRWEGTCHLPADWWLLTCSCIEHFKMISVLQYICTVDLDNTMTALVRRALASVNKIHTSYSEWAYFGKLDIMRKPKTH